MACKVQLPYLLAIRIRIVSSLVQRQLRNVQNNRHVFPISSDGNALVYPSMNQKVISKDDYRLLLPQKLYVCCRTMNLLTPATYVFHYARLLPALCSPSIVSNGCYG